MSTNKHAIIRYKALDKCFRNWYKQFFIDDLIEACDKAIDEYDGSEGGVSRRTILYDIDFMKSDSGWAAPIEGIQYGKKKYYRYSDPDFSIDKQPLTESELNQLKETILLLSRFKGESSYGWMEELVTNLEDKLGLKGSGKSVIGYEQNPFLHGIERLQDLFNYIVNKQVLRIRYRTFQDKEIVWVIHPYYIKQYNNRWYLFGHNDEHGNITNIPLDRIEDVQPEAKTFIKDDRDDFEEYFEDIIGVTIPPHTEVTAVQLKFDEYRFPYIISKPLHPSMRVIDREQRIVEIEVIPNKELESLILSFGNQVEVLSPEDFRILIGNKLMDSVKKYFAVQNGCTDSPEICSVKRNENH